MGGAVGLDLAGCAAALKCEGGEYWDHERDCIPSYTMAALRVVEREQLGWELCRTCRDARAVEKACSACGGPLNPTRPGTLIGPEEG